jgi:hypothetical protein
MGELCTIPRIVIHGGGDTISAEVGKFGSSLIHLSNKQTNRQTNNLWTRGLIILGISVQ